MPPNSNLSRATALMWLREMAENPMSDEEIEELERNNQNEKGNPFIAVSLEPDGTPSWWPWTHPNLDQRLTWARRRRWASDMLAGEWNPAKRMLFSADRQARRQLIARFLLQMLPRMSDGDLPAPDS
jgi:hypothetical protein